MATWIKVGASYVNLDHVDEISTGQKIIFFLASRREIPVPPEDRDEVAKQLAIVGVIPASAAKP